MATDTSFLLSFLHCFSHWYHLEYQRTCDDSLCARNRGDADIVQQWCASTFITVFLHFTKTTFTDYFSPNTKHLLKIFFTLKTRTSYKPPITYLSEQLFSFMHASEVLYREIESFQLLCWQSTQKLQCRVRPTISQASSLTYSPWQQHENCSLFLHFNPLVLNCSCSITTTIQPLNFLFP